MLRYVSFGSRKFGDHPMPPQTRPFWEFYAVLRGRVAPLFPDDWQPALASGRLWLLAPGSAHGWIGEPKRTALITVFHFQSVPGALERAVAERGLLSVPLAAADRTALAQAARALQPLYWNPDELFEFHSQRALMELTLLVLGRLAGKPATAPVTAPADRVRAAEAWFRAHLSEFPAVTNLARQVGTTDGHLRRLFLAVRGCSPKVMMTRIQLELAARLLARDDLKLDAVAAECGFSSASTLCRAFRLRHGLTPAEWRERRRRAPSSIA